MNALASTTIVPPALIVVSGGSHPPDHYRVRASSARLLAALPIAPSVLALGDRHGELANAYCKAHPNAYWKDVDASAPNALDAIEEKFALIVINGLERLAQPARMLADLAPLLQTGGQLRVMAENHARLSCLLPLIETDLSTGYAVDSREAGSLDMAYPRYFSPPSIYKMMMDTGWMPHLLDHEPDAATDGKIAAAAGSIADALGVGGGCADDVLRMSHLVIGAQRLFDQSARQPGRAMFDVVVPTNHERQLRVNVEQSPGLQEVQARIISYRHATNPAQALEGAMPQVQRDWVLLCHQDVYFPAGFGEQLNAVLASIPRQEHARTLLGFIGMGVSEQAIAPAGFVVDRLHQANHQAANAAMSLDELAIVVSRDTLHRIDPEIGWHLWATDLCLTAVYRHQVLARIVKLPLFHNSHTGWQLPAAFVDSAEYLMRKHSESGPIHTLCGVIEPSFVAQHRGR